MFRLSLVSVFGLILCSSAYAYADVHWGEFRSEGCPRKGFRQVSAVLWDVPWGKSWEEACRTTPSPICGRLPDRCVSDGIHEYGQWDMLDSSCP